VTPQLDQLRLETVADPLLGVRSGVGEEPHSDTLLGSVDLATIQRAYAANVEALKAMDGVSRTVAGT
jgi:flagellar basal body rod protein FlgC